MIGWIAFALLLGFVLGYICRWWMGEREVRARESQGDWIGAEGEWTGDVLGFQNATHVRAIE